MKRLALIAICGAMAIPAAAFAQAAAPAQAQSIPKKERQVCKTMEEPGSRLGGKRVCRTQAQWDELAAQQKQEIERRLSLGPARPSN